MKSAIADRVASEASPTDGVKLGSFESERPCDGAPPTDAYQDSPRPGRSGSVGLVHMLGCTQLPRAAPRALEHVRFSTGRPLELPSERASERVGTRIDRGRPRPICRPCCVGRLRAIVAVVCAHPASGEPGGRRPTPHRAEWLNLQRREGETLQPARPRANIANLLPPRKHGRRSSDGQHETPPDRRGTCTRDHDSTLWG